MHNNASSSFAMSGIGSANYSSSGWHNITNNITKQKGYLCVDPSSVRHNITSDVTFLNLPFFFRAPPVSLRGELSVWIE